MTDPNDPKTLTCNAGHEFITRAAPGARCRCWECGPEIRTKYRVPDTEDVAAYLATHRVSRKKAKQAIKLEAAEEPLTGAQRELTARARQDLKQLGILISRARLAGDWKAVTELRDRKHEVSTLLHRLLEDAEELKALETARLMTGRVAVDAPGYRRAPGKSRRAS